MLSDGKCYSSFAMLASSLNNLIHEKQLEPFTIIKVKKNMFNSISGEAKAIFVILELEILSPGSVVGGKIGNPQQIGAEQSTKSRNSEDQEANKVNFEEGEEKTSNSTKRKRESHVAFVGSTEVHQKTSDSVPSSSTLLNKSSKNQR